MRSKPLFFLSVVMALGFTFCLHIHAQNVSVDSDIQWTNVAAASYQCEFRDGGNTVLTLNDPATNDPNGDNILEVPSDPSGTTTVNLSLWLIGRNLGGYKFLVRSVDSNGNAGAYAELLITYSAPAPPVPTVAALNYQYDEPYNYAHRGYPSLEPSKRHAFLLHTRHMNQLHVA